MNAIVRLGEVPGTLGNLLFWGLIYYTRPLLEV
jgi:hypothetical protein